jgi:hypothetical protein
VLTAKLHNFKILLPENILKEYGGRPLHVHGLRVAEGTKNTALPHSGVMLVPCPLLKGDYKTEGHPFVFVTQPDLDSYAKRINTHGAFSRIAFDKLTAAVKDDLNSKRKWNAAYSGTDIDVYLHTFSYESLGGYKQETRSEAQLNEELHLAPSAKPPLGAAIVAARAALYAALLKAGAKPTETSAPKEDDAANLAKEILTAWAKLGFRNSSGQFQKSHKQFSENGKFSPESFAGVGLQVSRGRIYSIYAQDVLTGLGMVNDAEQAVIAGFDPYGYRGVKEQSIEGAAQYYACYAKHAGFGQTITESNCLACPNHKQYAGKIATGAPQMVQGAYWFPENKALHELQAEAKQSLSSKSAGLAITDPPAFGRWQD